MRADIEYVERKFREFNEKYFGGRLAPLPIRLSNGRSFLGKVKYLRDPRPFGRWHYRDFQLVMSTRFDLEETVLEDTLLHEMIHYDILSSQQQDSSAHGMLFRKKMAELNECYGRHITIRHSLKEQELQGGKGRSFLIAVSHFSDGRVGVTVAARAKVFELWNRLPLFPGVQRCEWFASTDPFFDRYPKARTPRIYKTTTAELNAHLIDARRLVRQGSTIYLAK